MPLSAQPPEFPSFFQGPGPPKSQHSPFPNRSWCIPGWERARGSGSRIQDLSQEQQSRIQNHGKGICSSSKFPGRNRCLLSTSPALVPELFIPGFNLSVESRKQRKNHWNIKGNGKWHQRIRHHSGSCSRIYPELSMWEWNPGLPLLFPVFSQMF